MRTTKSKKKTPEQVPKLMLTCLMFPQRVAVLMSKMLLSSRKSLLPTRKRAVSSPSWERMVWRYAILTLTKKMTRGRLKYWEYKPVASVILKSNRYPINFSLRQESRTFSRGQVTMDFLTLAGSSLRFLSTSWGTTLARQRTTPTGTEIEWASFL